MGEVQSRRRLEEDQEDYEYKVWGLGGRDSGSDPHVYELRSCSHSVQLGVRNKGREFGQSTPLCRYCKMDWEHWDWNNELSKLWSPARDIGREKTRYSRFFGANLPRR